MSFQPNQVHSKGKLTDNQTNITASYVLMYTKPQPQQMLLMEGPKIISHQKNGLSLGLEYGSTTVLGSTYVVERLSSSLVFFSILTFYFDLILW